MELPSSVYAASFEQAPEALAVLDGTGCLIAWNSAFGHFFMDLAGMAPGRLKSSFFNFIVESGGLRCDYFAAAVLLGGETSETVKTSLNAADGRQRWVQLSFSLIEIKPAAGDEGAEPQRFLLCSIDDMTDRVLRENWLREAKEEAEKATETKSLFLANMSHEIRTPIQTILSVVELLQDTKLDNEQDEYASQVRFSADVLLGLVNDILDFSKIEAGRFDLETIDFDLRLCLRQSVDLLVMDAHRKGLEVIVDIDPGLPAEVRGDPQRVRQIIVNLLKNAMKFTKEGSITLRAARCVRRAEGKDSAPKAFIHFDVMDTGIGVSPEAKARLFTPFFQADLAMARKVGGTGLGLAISRNLAELMGGRMGLEDNIPAGSIFWFEIPLVPVEGSRPPELASAPCPARLLIVDDSANALSFALKVTAAAGYKALGVRSGEEALASLRGAAASGQPFALCLIDQNMPRMDGWRLASEITGDTSINSARLILMVPEGTAGPDTKMKLLHWFNDYVSKPLRPDSLLEVLKKALSSEVDFENADPGAVAEKTKAEVADVLSFDADILLAEDHEVNRELFSLFLSRLGCRIAAAGDGVEAVELGTAALEKGSPFNLVLMDIFMPRMNGYEATQSLRAKGYKGPIIAVTASALKGERDKCLEAGMDDILVKPFKKAELQTLLSRWLPDRIRKGTIIREGAGAAAAGKPEAEPEAAVHAAAPAQPLAPVQTPAQATSPAQAASAAQEQQPAQAPASAETPAQTGPQGGAVFDWDAVLDTFLGQKQTVLSLLGRFSARAEQETADLKRELAEKNFSAFRETAHSMKGAAWNLSAKRLGDAAYEGEKAGRAGDEERAAAALNSICLELKAFKLAIQKYIV